MKKRTVMCVLLLVLPLAMVFVAFNPSSVLVFDGETVQTVSYLQTVPESIWGWCAPVAALLNYVLFGLAVIYAVAKKDWCLKCIFGIALAACCIVVLPIVIQSEIKIIPNVMGAVLLGADCLAARVAMKMPANEKGAEPTGERLSSR